MSVVHRHSLAAAGLVCLAALAPVPALAQGRTAQPNADTPRILIATFRTTGTDAREGHVLQEEAVTICQPHEL